MQWVRGSTDMQGTPPMCRAIREAREAAGWTIKRLSDELGVEINQVSGRWEKDREPSLPNIRRIEDALGLRRGYLLRSAGYVEDITTTEDAIANDQRLTPMQRDLVMGALVSMLARTG